MIIWLQLHQAIIQPHIESAIVFFSLTVFNSLNKTSFRLRIPFSLSTWTFIEMKTELDLNFLVSEFLVLKWDGFFCSKLKLDAHLLLINDQN